MSLYKRTNLVLPFHCLNVIQTFFELSSSLRLCSISIYLITLLDEHSTFDLINYWVRVRSLNHPLNNTVAYCIIPYQVNFFA